MVKCPDAKDTIGMVSTEVTPPLTVTGRTIGSRRKWEASLTDVGSDSSGRALLERSSSRPLAAFEIGHVFKALIAQLSEQEQDA